MLWSIEAKVRRETWRDRRRLAERGMPVGSRNMVYWVYEMGLERLSRSMHRLAYSVMAGTVFAKCANLELTRLSRSRRRTATARGTPLRMLLQPWRSGCHMWCLAPTSPSPIMLAATETRTHLVVVDIKPCQHCRAGISSQYSLKGGFLVTVC